MFDRVSLALFIRMVRGGMYVVVSSNIRRELEAGCQPKCHVTIKEMAEYWYFCLFKTWFSEKIDCHVTHWEGWKVLGNVTK